MVAGHIFGNFTMQHRANQTTLTSDITIDEIQNPSAFAHKFMVWALRKWVAGHKGVPGAHEMLRHSFPKTGARDGFAALDALMQAIAAGAQRHIAIHAPCCSARSNDEEAIVEALAAAQLDEKVEVGVLLAGMLTPTGMRAVEAPLRTLARTLKDTGLTLPSNRIWTPPAHIPPLSAVPTSTAVH